MGAAESTAQMEKTLFNMRVRARTMVRMGASVIFLCDCHSILLLVRISLIRVRARIHLTSLQYTSKQLARESKACEKKEAEQKRNVADAIKRNQPVGVDARA
jgi:hypothetical protein